ncbi:hypothetical protein Pfo_022068 [Paulownia fortunei]|nr:hypothetical protein Pfo_022068 [Paulownia fortunei]
MACCCSPSTTLSPSVPLLLKNPRTHFLDKFQSKRKVFTKSDKCEYFSRYGGFHRSPFTWHCTRFSTPTLVSDTESEYETEEYDSSAEYAEEGEGQQCPGEKKGVTEEMRFVAMKLRNSGKRKSKGNSAAGGETDEEEVENDGEKGNNFSEKNDDDEDGETWQPSMEGFLKYLVDSRLVFSTVERIVDESSDVSYVYFRKTGLERSDCLSGDLEWFSQQGNVIPEPSNPGVEYAQYLEELAENSPPLFLCHFYNIYLSHSWWTRRELEFHRWEGDPEDLLKGVREKLNALGEKNKCLREATKAFRFLGQIVQLIIL